MHVIIVAPLMPCSRLRCSRRRLGVRSSSWAVSNLFGTIYIADEEFIAYGCPRVLEHCDSSPRTWYCWRTTSARIILHCGFGAWSRCRTLNPLDIQMVRASASMLVESRRVLYRCFRRRGFGLSHIWTSWLLGHAVSSFCVVGRILVGQTYLPLRRPTFQAKCRTLAFVFIAGGWAQDLHCI